MAQDRVHVREFARSCTEAWCSHDPARVAGHYDQAEYDRQLQHGAREPS